MKFARVFYFGLVACLAVAVRHVHAFGLAMVEPIRRAWPEAFPTASPAAHDRAQFSLVENAAYDARSTQTYALRRQARTRHDLRLAPSLYIAV